MTRIWTEEKDNLLRRHYPKGDLDWVARRIGVSKAALKCRAQILGIRRKVHRREPWTDRQLAYLRRHYADMRAEDIAKRVRHTVGSVWRTATSISASRAVAYRSTATSGSRPTERCPRVMWSPCPIGRLSSRSAVLKHVWHCSRLIGKFRDGNRQNCDLANLYLLSRADNARRRVSEETPEARKARLAKAQTTRKKSIRRDKLRLHWGMEPLGKLVKRW